jgi:hypothetical protein
MTNPRLVVLSFLSLALSGPWASASAPAGRYTVSNGVVYDTRTRLSWQQTPPSTTYVWLPGRDYCTSLGAGWRLPTYKELFTIVDFSRTTPAIDITAFPGTVSASYWSMTFRPSDTDSKLRTVNFSNGSPNLVDAGTPSYVRCVRWNG